MYAVYVVLRAIRIFRFAGSPGYVTLPALTQHHQHHHHQQQQHHHLVDHCTYFLSNVDEVTSVPLPGPEVCIALLLSSPQSSTKFGRFNSQWGPSHRPVCTLYREHTYRHAPCSTRSLRTHGGCAKRPPTRLASHGFRRRKLGTVGHYPESQLTARPSSTAETLSIAGHTLRAIFLIFPFQPIMTRFLRRRGADQTRHKQDCTVVFHGQSVSTPSDQPP